MDSRATELRLALLLGAILAGLFVAWPEIDLAASGLFYRDGAWLLPNQTRRRTPDEMPAHKRAMYRRRYALLDALAALVAAGLQAPAAAPEPLLG